MDHTIIPNTADYATLATAAHATMRITNQKNGARGSIICHDTSNTDACPVASPAESITFLATPPGQPITSLAHTTPPRAKAYNAYSLVTSTAHSKRPSLPLVLTRKVSHPLALAAILFILVEPWPCTSMASHMLPSANKDAGPPTPFLCTSMSK